MKINLIYNKKIPDFETSLNTMKTILDRKNSDYKSFDIENMQTYGDFTITLGGDGTILRTAKYYAQSQTPVFGINVGRLGFLSHSGMPDEIISELLENNYYIENRLMLESSGYLALNDFVIKGCNPSRTSNFYLEIDGKTVCNYIADGIIISTPTGSTAYGLSAGGPVLYPSLDAIVIVPICPHTLNARPLVIPSEAEISVKTNDKLLNLSIDGYDTTECIDKITIKVSKQKSVLAFLNNRNFYSVLKDKLLWGIPPKNI